MPQHHHKLLRKELKQDDFTGFFDQAQDFVGRNLAAILIWAAVAVVVAIFALIVWIYVSQQRQAVAEQFYQAQYAFAHQDYDAAAAGFKGLAHDRPHYELGRLANLYLGNVYAAQGNWGGARDALNQYLAVAGADRVFRGVALAELGVADENLGQLSAARDAYAEAAQIDGPEKDAAALGVARILAQLGDKAGAIAAYRSFLKDNPFSPNQPDVTAALARLGAAPDASTPAAKAPAPPSVAATHATAAASPSK